MNTATSSISPEVTATRHPMPAGAEISLHRLIEAHRGAYAALCAAPLDNGNASDAALYRALEIASAAVLAHRPATLAEVSEKACYLAGHEHWQDLPAAEVCAALMPAPGALS